MAELIVALDVQTKAGVLYGYGDREELETAGADYIAKMPTDILNFLQNGAILFDSLNIK